MADQYVVIQRSGKWWFTVDGERRGPFELRKEAIDAAVGTARVKERAGRDGEVSWMTRTTAPRRSIRAKTDRGG